MTTIAELPQERIQEFRTRLRGKLLGPGDDSYDAVRTVWNAMIDRRPALIARCVGAADVIAAVCFAREHDLLVSVRGGGHNVAGLSVCDGGLMIDLSPMKGIRVDPAAGDAHVPSPACCGPSSTARLRHSAWRPLGAWCPPPVSPG